MRSGIRPGMMRSVVLTTSFPVVMSTGSPIVPVVIGALVAGGARRRAIRAVPGKAGQAEAGIGDDLLAVLADGARAPDVPVSDREVEVVHVELRAGRRVGDVGEIDGQGLRWHRAAGMDREQHG